MTTALATLPTVGTWNIDPTHTTIEAVARHMMVAKVRVRFASFEGAVQIAEPVTDSTIEVTMHADSIESGEGQRDGHLKSPDFLDVETYPTLRFVSTGITAKGGDDYEVAGNLTIKDVTKPVTLAMTFLGSHPDAWGGVRAGFEAVTEVDREEFGVTWNQVIEAGGVAVSKKIKIELNVELVQA